MASLWCTSPGCGHRGSLHWVQMHSFSLSFSWHADKYRQEHSGTLPQGYLVSSLACPPMSCQSTQSLATPQWVEGKFGLGCWIKDAGTECIAVLCLAAAYVGLLRAWECETLHIQQTAWGCVCDTSSSATSSSTFETFLHIIFSWVDSKWVFLQKIHYSLLRYSLPIWCIQLHTGSHANALF